MILGISISPGYLKIGVILEQCDLEELQAWNTRKHTLKPEIHVCGGSKSSDDFVASKEVWVYSI